MKSIKNKKNRLESIQFRLFGIMCLTSILTVTIIVILNNLILKYSYTYNKIAKAVGMYNSIDDYYNKDQSDRVSEASSDSNLSSDVKGEVKTENSSKKPEENIDELIRDFEFDNNMEIFLVDKNNKTIYASRDQIDKEFKYYEIIKDGKVVYNKNNICISEIQSDRYSEFLIMEAKLNNNYKLYAKIQLDPIKETVRVTSRTLLIISGSMVMISAIMSLIISSRFAEPIIRLNRITKKMADLDFSEKYRITDGTDEVNELGKNINEMSDKLEKTFNRLQRYNNELERDIEEKAKIDEMRKQFISDVSHELKTPIGLIQGYSEGLIENVNDDEESRKFYAEVIADEANKMDKMVKELLELMKVENADVNIINEEFDLKELIDEEIKRQTVIIKENKIKIIFKEKKMPVYTSQKYMERVFNNFITNAIKHCEKKNGKKEIIVRSEIKDDKIRVYVYNTGERIPNQYINKIWDRFYKIDTAREREKGGTGIGLSLVKAIMKTYGNEYGVKNVDDGVEFYCDINRAVKNTDDEKNK